MKHCVFCERKKKVDDEHAQQWLCAHCGRWNNKYKELTPRQVQRALKDLEE